MAAVHRFGERSVEPEDLNTLASRAILPFDPVQRQWRGQRAGIVALERSRGSMGLNDGCSAPLSLLQTGPYVAVLDGTIDNCEELSVDLKGDIASRHGQDTLRLLIAGYAKWGRDLPKHLTGEFAMILWDRLESCLFAARDPFGVRPLFYSIQEDEVVLGSQLRQVLEPAAISFEALDKEYIADLLAWPLAFGERTAFRQVKRLKAGHVLLASRGRIDISPYWDLEANEEIQHWSDEQCYLEFRNLFEDAVSAYMKTGGRVWAELSGGLDSSSIVSMASRLSPCNSEIESHLNTVTFTWPKTPQCDEQAWAKVAIGECHLRGHFISGEGQFFFGALEEAKFRDDPHFGLLCSPLQKSEAELLTCAGVDVLLSGARAESVVLQEDQYPYHLSDLARAWKIGQLIKELVGWQRHLAVPYLGVLYAYVLRPLLRPSKRPTSWARSVTVPPWVTRGFCESLELEQRASRWRRPRRYRRSSQQVQYEMLRRSDEAAPLGYLGWSVEVRYPFLYRPLAEFAFSVPWQAKIAPGSDKRLLREGMEGILPQRIRHRHDWKSPNYSAYRTLVRNWGEVGLSAKGSHLVALGVFDREKWDAALHRARYGGCDDFATLTSSMALELWLQSFFGTLG